MDRNQVDYLPCLGGEYFFGRAVRRGRFAKHGGYGIEVQVFKDGKLVGCLRVRDSHVRVAMGRREMGGVRKGGDWWVAQHRAADDSVDR